MQEIAERLAQWREHPAQMVREQFGIEPDRWQEEVLEAFPHNQRIAMKACKGPGKTAVLAWLAWNFLQTRPHPKCAATSISGDNLRDNFWTEMAKWQAKSEFLKAKFTWTKTRIFANDHPETWFMSARTWPQSADKAKQADTLAGLHADYILFILDETGGIPDAVMVSAEAALSSCVEGHIVQAGNPTQRSGPLYRASNSRHLWFVVEITGDPDDPKRSPRISVQWAREQIETHGRDDPWVLINVFGQFPPSSLNALIGDEEVSAAMGRYWREHEIGNAPKILGVDVARFGDDASVIASRQGIQMFPLMKHRNLTSTQGAGLVARKWVEWDADATFVDNTGGYGSGWIDQLVQLGKAPIPVEFAGRAHEPRRYYNKRAEMYFDFVAWIKRGGALPRSNELMAGLTQTTYTFKGDRILLEPKDQVKLKLGYSPDDADAGALTFAEPVSPRGLVARAPASRSAVNPNYDPYASLSDSVARSYDPFR